MNRQTPIMDAVYTICDDVKARFCMPGHKGDIGFFCGDMLHYDITELPGTDNLLYPKQIISESQALHAKYIGADAIYYTTGGSTACILAMLSLFRGKKVVFPRGIHLSAANAIAMFDIIPVYLGIEPCDYPAVVNADDIKNALRAHKDAAAVFIVYPNYFGLCCDIEKIAKITHKAGLPLVVDAAHAAHFVYSSLLPLAPSHAGADIWTESAHKTLPAMNQCACLGIGKNALLDKEKAKHALSDIQTTSPSYILLTSLDYAHAYMRDKGEQELYRIISLSNRFKEMVNALPGYSCPEISQTGAVDKDCLKMIIDVSGTGHTGIDVKNILASQGIHVEAADIKNILLLLTVGNTAAHLETLYEALKRIERTRGRNIYFSPYSMPEATKYSQNHRLWGNIEKVRIEQSVGLVSACTAGVYPPAEAVIQRGQVISFEIAGYLLEAQRQGFDVFGIEDNSIWVCKEKI
ncbi:MAG: aminotransferase class I/II-fold pyridoxal phosphate-dependent enzyme [Christensenellales bacterium]|jgi:arginine/lysine/ornithine decarboxylase